MEHSDVRDEHVRSLFQTRVCACEIFVHAQLRRRRHQLWRPFETATAPECPTPPCETIQLRCQGFLAPFFVVFFVADFFEPFLLLLDPAFATFFASVPSAMSRRLPLDFAMYAGTPSLN